MSAFTGLAWLLYWVCLPAVLLASVLFRYNALSAVYLIFLLIIPYTPSFSVSKISTCVSITLTLTILSAIFLISRVGFQIFLLATPPYGNILGAGCSAKESIARYIGYERLDHTDAANLVRILLPDVAVFLFAIASHIAVRKLAVQLQHQNEQQQSHAAPVVSEKKQAQMYAAAHLKNGSLLCFTMLFLALAGIAFPSVISSVYLLTFLLLALLWAFNQEILVPSVAGLRASLSALTFLHLLLMYLYQMQFLDAYIPPQSIYTRLFGLVPIIRTNCSATYQLLVNSNLAWPVFVSPACVLLLHWFSAVGVVRYFTDREILSAGPREDATQVQKARSGKRSNDEKKDSRREYEEWSPASAPHIQPLVQSEEEQPNYASVEPAPAVTESTAPESSQAKPQSKRGFLQKLSNMLSSVKFYSFYMVALIIMLLWSVTYHSWLTFVLLIWSCVLWMVKKRSFCTMVCSPVFTVYGILLVLLQFVYSLNLNESELPTVINQTNGQVLYLSAFGCRRFTYPCLHLGAQILYLCGFFLVLHQWIFVRKRGGLHQENDQAIASWTDRAVVYVKDLFCRYWIFVVVGFHIAISSEGHPTGIKVIYMALLLLNIVTYILSFLVWRKTLALYWTVLVFYTMIVLIVIYTYQFQSFPQYWKSFTNFSDVQLNDLGLIQYNTAQFLLMMLLPALFLLSVVLQLQYFNKRFLELTNPPTHVVGNGSAQPSPGPDGGQEIEMNEMDCGTSKKGEDKRGWFASKGRKLLKFLGTAYCALCAFILRALEFHMWRLVAITVFAAAVSQVSVAYAILVIFWISFLPARIFHTVLYIVTALYVSLILLGDMFYQLEFIRPGNNVCYNCTFDVLGQQQMQKYNFLDWFGLIKMPSKSGVFFYHAEGYIAIILMIGLERTVMRRQEWRRLWRNEPESVATAFYPSITYKEVDKGLLECTKFFLNYFFYKFGVEACFVMTVITIWVRMDVYATVYAILLIICMCIKTRQVMSRYWRFYIIALILLLLLQYLICLGMPPLWCTTNQYPWAFLANQTHGYRLIRWLYLPDFIIKPNSTTLLADFFQLLFVVSQLFVFEKETNVWLNFGGDNRYLTSSDLDNTTSGSNPKSSFLKRRSRSLLDQLKTFVFKYAIWGSLAVIFFAGTSRISLFCLGYLISFFYLLYKLQSLTMGKPSVLLRVWNVILGYNVAVITLKATLQIASCVYIDILQQKACAFVQIMSLVCSYPAGYGITVQATSVRSSCELAYVNAGLTWDFVCFVFLLIQRRIFQSYYFLHVQNDMNVSMQLASRGAELFKEKLIQEVQAREEQEEATLRIVKKSMHNIKEAYATLRRGMSHIVSHGQAVRSGDYYMFDDQDDRPDLSVAPDEIMDPVTMMHKAGTIGLDETLKERKKDKVKLDTDDKVVVEIIADKTEGDEDATDGSESDHDHKSECAEEPQQKEKEKYMKDKAKRGLKFVWELWLSLVDSITLKLNNQNLDYRNVTLRLNSEKDRLSRKYTREELTSPSSLQQSSSDVAIVVEERTESPSQAEEESPARSLSTSEDASDLQAVDIDKDQNRALRFFYAVWYVVISHTDWVCYFLIILNLMLNATLLSLVLPLTLYLWACFSVPRPTKYFWTFVLIYLQLVIVVKFLFQFELFPWNSAASTNLNANDPFWPPRFIGVEQSSTWMVMELLQLLAVFLHISVIKVHGLWDTVEQPVGEEVEEENQAEENIQLEEAQPSTSRSHLEEEDESEEGRKVLKENGESDDDSNKTTFVEKALNFCKRPFNHLSSVLHQRFTAVDDIYIYIFLCDVINFIIIIFGYWAFGPYSTQQTNVVSSIQSNQVPTGFLVMLLFQFSMMFIDRAIYLRKSLFGKMIFQIVLVIGIHAWLFFILPSINKRPFYMNSVAQTWYFFKALYFLLSAYQIRVGYPKRVRGNFLTKSYGTVNLFLFKGYRAVPFLAEVTAIMNWMYSDTSMDMGEWMKLWSIHAEVFELKCWREFEKAYPGPRGEAKSKLIKYIVGGLIVFFLLAIIFFPLILMNVVMTIAGVANNPVQVDVKLSVGTFEPLFQVASDASQISVFNATDYAALQKKFAQVPTAAQFLNGFTNNEVVNVAFDGQSKTRWIISPPQKRTLTEKLSANNTQDVPLRFDWTLTKNTSKTTISSAVGSNTINLAVGSQARQEMYQLLMGNATVNATATFLYPQYIYSGATTSQAVAASSLYTTSQIFKGFVNVTMVLRTDPANNSTFWWNLYQNKESVPQMKMTIFSSKVSPSSLSFLVNYGIIGLYVSIVLVVGKLVRSVFVGATSTIMFLELPNVDRILQLCDDIFLVREEDEFELEEDLYAKLIFLYREPALLIKWAKPKND